MDSVIVKNTIEIQFLVSRTERNFDFDLVGLSPTRHVSISISISILIKKACPEINPDRLFFIKLY